MTHAARLLAVVAVACCVTGLGAGCANQVKKTDYDRYLACMPKSVVVLPPLNESTQVRAPEAFLSTISAPLAERGYYVFPVALVHGMLRENGLPTSGEMHQVPPQKFRDVFGADAVLYITIKEWTNRYIVIDSTTSVRLAYRLVDTATGEEIWRREQTVAHSSNQNSGGSSDLGAALIGAAITAAVHAGSNVDGHRERQLAIQANAVCLADPNHGMLLGSRHPEFAKDQKLRTEEAAKQQVSAKQVAVAGK